jgi:hypothetical protein
MDVTKVSKGDCAITISGDYCMDADLLHDLYAKVRRGPPKSKASAYKALYKALGVDPAQPSAEVVLLNAAKSQYPELRDAIDGVIDRNFKVAMKPCPTDAAECEWLSNFDIDSTCEALARKYKYYKHLDFVMSDFHKYPALPINQVRIATLNNKGYKCFGFALNIDVYTGRGIHWTTVFVSWKNPKAATVEFYNSVGKPPGHACMMFMERCVEQMAEIGISATRYFSGVPSEGTVGMGRSVQRDDSSCGVYTIYYIMSRVLGVPPDDFATKNISDADMRELRDRVFRDPGDGN